MKVQKLKLRRVCKACKQAVIVCLLNRSNNVVAIYHVDGFFIFLSKQHLASGTKD